MNAQTEKQRVRTRRESTKRSKETNKKKRRIKQTSRNIEKKRVDINCFRRSFNLALYPRPSSKTRIDICIEGNAFKCLRAYMCIHVSLVRMYNDHIQTYTYRTERRASRITYDEIVIIDSLVSQFWD